MGENDKKDSSCRKWLVTINNPLDKGYTHERLREILQGIRGIEYWCFCDEVGGKTHTFHTHVYLFRDTAIRFSRMRNLFPGADLRMCKGTSQENRDYIRKEGKYRDSEKSETNLKDSFEEFGDVPQERQGQRTDLNALYDMIKDGLSDFEILEDNPSYMTKLDSIERVRETIRYQQFSNRKREVRVEYWYGKPGVGKTWGVLGTHGFQNVYIVDDFRHPWDCYKGQDVVLFDEFDAECFDLNLILRWLDVYPVSLPCRYNNKQACYTKVFFTSNKRFEDQYSFIRRNDKDLFDALVRRFHCFKVFDGVGHVVEYGDYDSYLHASGGGFVSVPPGVNGPFGK